MNPDKLPFLVIALSLGVVFIGVFVAIAAAKRRAADAAPTDPQE